MEEFITSVQKASRCIQDEAWPDTRLRFPKQLAGVGCFSIFVVSIGKISSSLSLCGQLWLSNCFPLSLSNFKNLTCQISNIHYNQEVAFAKEEKGFLFVCFIFVYLQFPKDSTGNNVLKDFTNLKLIGMGMV